MNIISSIYYFQNDQQTPNGQATDESSAPDSAPSNGLAKKKLTLSFEDYKNLSNMLVLHLRNEENKLQDDDNATEGLRRSDVINWYLEQIEDQIFDEDELIQRKTMIEKVIDRLIYHDQVIIPLTNTGLADRRPQQQQASEDDADEPLLVVHPNYIIE